MVDQYNERFELGQGITAIIGVEVSVREFERVEYFRTHWVDSAEPHEKATRATLVVPLCCIRDIEGLPDGVKWHPLPRKLTPDCAELMENAEILRRDEIGMRPLIKLGMVLGAKTNLTEEDLKKFGGG